MLAVRALAADAIDAARGGEGPCLVEAKTYRHKGHSKLDPGRYRAKEEVEQWLARDPLTVLGAQLAPDVVERVDAAVVTEMEQVVADALAAAPARSLAGVSAYCER